MAAVGRRAVVSTLTAIALLKCPVELAHDEPHAPVIEGVVQGAFQVGRQDATHEEGVVQGAEVLDELALREG